MCIFTSVPGCACVRFCLSACLLVPVPVSCLCPRLLVPVCFYLCLLVTVPCCFCVYCATVDRYVSLLKGMSPGGKSSGIVYVPARQGFVSSSSASAGGGPPVGLFFDLQELRVRSLSLALFCSTVCLLACMRACCCVCLCACALARVAAAVFAHCCVCLLLRCVPPRLFALC